MSDSTEDYKREGAAVAANSEHINSAFEILPTQLLADVAARKISITAYVLYAFLRFWQGTNRDLWYGVKSIAEKTGFSESTVKRRLEELVEAGHITRKKRMGANWRTECHTLVDQNKQVFVAGKLVGKGKKPTGKPESEKRAQEAPVVKTKRLMAAAEFAETLVKIGPKPTSEPQLSPLAKLDSIECLLGPDATPARDEPESNGNIFDDPNLRHPQHDAWMSKVEWSMNYRQVFTELQRRFRGDLDDVKRQFLEKMKWESPGIFNLAREEFPDIAERFPKKTRNEVSARVAVTEESKEETIQEITHPGERLFW